MAKIKNIEGMKFGRLIALNQFFIKNKHTYWLCKCDCGKEKYIRKNDLIRGKTQSCGCKKKESKFNNKRLINIFKKMKERCYKEYSASYKNYGKRGIKICDEWLKDFESFYRWAMANGYKDNLTIDRIDVNGNYEPCNCRWATVKQQNNNSRKNHYTTINGVTKTIAQWAEHYNKPYWQMQQEIYKLEKVNSLCG